MIRIHTETREQANAIRIDLLSRGFRAATLEENGRIHTYTLAKREDLPTRKLRGAIVERLS